MAISRSSFLKFSPVVVQAINLIRLEILSNYTTCTHLVEIVDVTQASWVLDEEKLESKEASSFVIVSIFDKVNSTVEFPRHPPKFSAICSLGLYDVTNILKTFRQGNNFGFEEWPLLSLYGDPYEDFHLYFVENFAMPLTKTPVLEFAKITRKIMQAYFVVYNAQEVEFYARSTDVERLVWLSTYSVTFGSLEKFQLLQSKMGNNPDFEGMTMAVKVCAKCGNGIARFRETGKFYDFAAATIYELFLAVNATPELEPVFSLPSDGLNEEGDWDDWAQPLVDGSAAISTLMRHSIVVSKVVHFSRPIAHDSCCFITGKPRKAENPELFSKLIAPLGFEVWIGALISLIGFLIVFLATLEACGRGAVTSPTNSSQFHVRMETPDEKRLLKNMRYWAVATLLRSVVDQGGSSAFQREIQYKMLSRFLLAVWFLMIIVLGCGYKSKMTSLVVSPIYTAPPTTFKELAESKFQLNAVFWEGIIKKDFVTMDNDYSRKILDRVTEHNYYDNDVSFNA